VRRDGFAVEFVGLVAAEPANVADGCARGVERLELLHRNRNAGSAQAIDEGERVG
jgi:hypothetical protein